MFPQLLASLHLLCFQQLFPLVSLVGVKMRDILRVGVAKDARQGLQCDFHAGEIPLYSLPVYWLDDCFHGVATVRSIKAVIFMHWQLVGCLHNCQPQITLLFSSPYRIRRENHRVNFITYALPAI